MPYKDPEARRAHDKAYHQRNRDKLLAQMKDRYRQHKDERRAYSIEWHKKHPEWRDRYNRQYYAEHKEQIREVGRKYRQRLDREHRRAVMREWYAKNHEARKKYNREYVQKRIAIDIDFAIRNRLRCRMYMLFRRTGKPKAETSLQLVGCSIEEFREHLQAQFTDGMTWANRRLWEIDHIRPCSSFDLTDPEQQRACFHYSNLRPLWKAHNRSKGAKWETAA